MVSVAALPVLLAPLLGPVIAGAILQFASWRWLFLINLPVGVLALALAAAFLPDDREETRPRGLDLLGLVLLSPGLVLFLYGCDHSGRADRRRGPAVSIIMFALFYRTARAKGDAALIDLRLSQGQGVLRFDRCHVHGQRHLLRRPDADSDLSGPRLRPVAKPNWLAAGASGTWHDVHLSIHGPSHAAVRHPQACACGALLALAGTLPLVFLAQHGLVVTVLAVSLFIRGVGVSAIGIPSITSGYASVARQDLPMATTAMNIVQRLGGPTLTTLCATFLGWRLAAAPDTVDDVWRLHRGVRSALRLARAAVPRHPPAALAGA